TIWLSPRAATRAIAIAAKAKVFFELLKNEDLRNRFSTQVVEAHAAMIETKMMAILSRTPRLSERPSLAERYGTRTMSGQCQRYTEYEMSPRKRTGRNDRSGSTDALPRESASITSAVDATGT